MIRLLKPLCTVCAGFLLAGLLLSSPLHAQSPWEELGPDGGEVTAFAQDPVNPMNLYVGTSSRGVFLSRDGGVSWQISRFVVDRPVLGLTVGPAENPGVWTAAGSEVYSSTDGISRWFPTGFPPVGPARALVAGPEYLYAGTFRGLFRLEGSTWAQIGARQGFDNGTIYELHITQDGGLLVASVQGLFLSLDQGENFQHLGAGVFQNGVHVVQDPDSTVLYVSSFIPRAIFRSNAARTSWENITDTLPSRIFTSGFTRRSTGLGSEIYVLAERGLYRSRDDGDSWQRVGPEPQQSFGALGLHTDAANGTRLLATGTAGVASSTDGGRTWQGASQGLHVLALADYVVAPTDPRRIYASARLGTVFRGSDDGAPWQLIAQEDVSVEAALALDPTNPLRIYRGVSGGVQRSDDGGDTWTRSETDLLCSEVNSLAVAPSSPSTLYATGYTLTSGCPLSFPEACFAHRSLDRGVTWSCIAEPRLGLAARSAGQTTETETTSSSNPGPETASEASIGKLVDRGLGKKGPVAAQLGFHQGQPGLTQRLTVDPRDAQRVYALQWDGFLRTSDGGDSWTVLLEDLEPPYLDFFLDFALDPANPDVIYLVTGVGLLRSPDRGDTWVRWDLEPSPGPFEAIAVHPTAPDNLYAIAGDSTLWSTDSGRTWRELPGEAERLRLHVPLRILEREPTHLYAGTSGAGVVRRTVPVETECVADAQTLCLGGTEGDRFEVSVTWEDFQGRTGTGQGLLLPNGPGAFWFFDEDNLELAVKILDGRPVNGHWWVFFGALTNVEFTLTVRDTATGQAREYFNPLRNFASRGDTRAFPGSGLLPEGSSAVASSQSLGDPFSSTGWLALPAGALPAADGALPEGGCTANGTDDALALCLAERFLVRVTWRDFQDRTGTGKAIPLTDDTGSFWFFSPNNTEMLVKVLDGRPVNGHWWVFFGSLTNVEFTLTVEDVVTGEEQTYVNPLRTFASRSDTQAFDG